MKVKMLVEFEYDEDIMYGSEDGKEWFFNDVLANGELSLYSEEIGDMIGEVTVTHIYED